MRSPIQQIHDSLFNIDGNNYHEFVPPVKVNRPEPLEPLYIHCAQATEDGFVDLYTNEGDERLNEKDRGFDAVAEALIKRFKYEPVKSFYNPIASPLQTAF